MRRSLEDIGSRASGRPVWVTCSAERSANCVKWSTRCCAILLYIHHDILPLVEALVHHEAQQILEVVERFAAPADQGAQVAAVEIQVQIGLIVVRVGSMPIRRHCGLETHQADSLGQHLGGHGCNGGIFVVHRGQDRLVTTRKGGGAAGATGSAALCSAAAGCCVSATRTGAAGAGVTGAACRLARAVSLVALLLAAVAQAQARVAPPVVLWVSPALGRVHCQCQRGRDCRGSAHRRQPAPGSSPGSAAFGNGVFDRFTGEKRSVCHRSFPLLRLG